VTNKKNKLSLDEKIAPAHGLDDLADMRELNRSGIDVQDQSK
jgi:hypothetical protein|tara:strand:+ start:1204 stop:1329 length:126 start_codon:yes stop_codon:yes gene_type:complete